jgi:OHCU decarboxylase
LPEKITIDELNRLGEEEFLARFGSLYERSPWIAEEAWRERPFGDLSELHGAFLRAMYDAPPERRLDLIRAHPDLAGRAAIAGELTPESSGEQASAGLDRLSPHEYEVFQEVNGAYREKFGFPFIVCVREHTKETILAGVEARLEHSRPEEIETALGEIAKIANLRLRDLVEPEPGERSADATYRERHL